MDASRLAAAITARRKALYRSEAPSNQAQNDDYFLDQESLIIAEEIINEITTYARCSGNDSHGDSHDNVQIV